MYKHEKSRQITFDDFNQLKGLRINPENRWIKLADSIPWLKLEESYAALFPSKTGNVAKSCRMHLDH